MPFGLFSSTGLFGSTASEEPAAAAARHTPCARAGVERRIEVLDVAKTFRLHAQGGAEIPVMAGARLSVGAGECVALTGASGAGKSTLMRILYGNYLAASGAVRIWHDDDWLDVASASPHEVLELRRRTLGYVSQFLEVIPRVSTLDVVSEPLTAVGQPKAEAETTAKELLTQLRIQEALWPLSPLTFSGGERQRVNIARGMAHPYPCLLLDEPTASLDAANRETVLMLIEAAKARGAAIIGIFHDAAARERVCDREIDVSRFAASP